MKKGERNGPSIVLPTPSHEAFLLRSFSSASFQPFILFPITYFLRPNPGNNLFLNGGPPKRKPTALGIRPHPVRTHTRAHTYTQYGNGS